MVGQLDVLVGLFAPQRDPHIARFVAQPDVANLSLRPIVAVEGALRVGLDDTAGDVDRLADLDALDIRCLWDVLDVLVDGLNRAAGADMEFEAAVPFLDVAVDDLDGLAVGELRDQRCLLVPQRHANPASWVANRQVRHLSLRAVVAVEGTHRADIENRALEVDIRESHREILNPIHLLGLNVEFGVLVGFGLVDADLDAVVPLFRPAGDPQHVADLDLAVCAGFGVANG